jgi:hypothetical protein
VEKVLPISVETQNPQDGPKWPQDKMSQNGPNMTPRWPNIDLKIIKKPLENQ